MRGFISNDNGMVFENCCLDLEREGYAVQAFIIPACAVNAPHRRDRVWIVAHSTSGGCFNGSDNREERYIQGASIGTVEENQSERGGRFDRIERTDCHAPDTEKQRLSKSRPQPELNKATERFGIEYSNRHAPDTESRQRLQGHENESVISGGETRKECCRSGSESLPNSTHERLQGSLEAIRKEGQESNDELLHGCGGEWNQPWIEVATRLCRVDDGTAEELYKLETSDRVARLKALGNGIVPQVAFEIMRAIMETEAL